MKVNWRLFVGSKVMFWLYLIVMFFAIGVFILTYVIDPIDLVNLRVQKINSIDIEEFSEEYVNRLGINIDKKINYRFVRYITDKGYEADDDDEITLGTFHVWNNEYYIDISVDIYKTSKLQVVVVHETRHMIVEYMRMKNIIDLSKYSEEIAQGENAIYNNLFNNGVELLKEKQKYEEEKN